MDTELARNIKNADYFIQYDAYCKKVLANKQILAWILKSTTKEFREYDISTIIKCIEGTPSISSVKVNPGETNNENISGMTNEAKVANEGVIYYDIQFYAYTPVEKNQIKIIVNIEAQKKFNPGYEIVTRGIFYDSRMISAQLGKEFAIPNYDDLKKVYSIWICMNAPQYVGNAISSYTIQKTDLVPGIPDKPEAYDKLAVVIIALDENSSSDLEILQMLNTLLSSNKKSTEKCNELESRFHLDMSNELGKEIDIMCNLSGYVEEKGIEKGIKKGIKKGVKEGIEKGDRKRQLKTAINMLKLGTFSDKDILTVTEMSQEDLNELKKKLYDMSLF